MNNIKKTVVVTIFGFMISGVAMAEPEAGDFTLNFDNHISIQDVSISKISFSHDMTEGTSFLELDHQTNK